MQILCLWPVTVCAVEASVILIGRGCVMMHMFPRVSLVSAACAVFLTACSSVCVSGVHRAEAGHGEDVRHEVHEQAAVHWAGRGPERLQRAWDPSGDRTCVFSKPLVTIKWFSLVFCMCMTMALFFPSLYFYICSKNAGKVWVCFFIRFVGMCLCSSEWVPSEWESDKNITALQFIS